ncbi:protein YgfX [Andreprevotia chitinilytica]|uniref:protein YgfX n=1 Tax=Andreprevotia chitinilytica TaxID=396808 RepID=UPI00068AB864|nr:protein YgfX [Andreprevotia chitinilytica]
MTLPPSLLLNPSKQARYLGLFLHVAALIVAVCLPLSWMVFALLLVVASFWLARRSRPQPQRLEALPDGLVRIRWPDGRTLDATVHVSTRVTSWITVLQLDAEKLRTTLLLWPDSAAADPLRQWRVWLRWSQPSKTVTDDQH